jgi:two-component system response regulator AtoC
MYRLRVVPLFLPPLVEREGDVEALAWYFIDQHNERGPRKVDCICKDAYEALLNYPWPGNVRELQNAIEYAFAIGQGTRLELDELPPELRGLPPPRTRGSSNLSPEEADKERIMEALRTSKGSKSHAAELLGISRTTLWRRMRELKL